MYVCMLEAAQISTYQHEVIIRWELNEATDYFIIKQAMYGLPGAYNKYVNVLSIGYVSPL